jgi:hypothetical protein
MSTVINLHNGSNQHYNSSQPISGSETERANKRIHFQNSTEANMNNPKYNYIASTKNNLIQNKTQNQYFDNKRKAVF